MNNGTTYYNSQYGSRGGQWSQGAANGFGGGGGAQQNYQQQRSFQSGGYSNGFNKSSNNGSSNGFGGGFSSSNGFGGGGGNGFGMTSFGDVTGQGFGFGSSDSNGFSNNNMNGFGGSRNSSSSSGFPRNESFTSQSSDWSKQSAGNDTQEKDLFDSGNSGINFDKYDDIPVQVSGGNPPQPIETFCTANLHEFVQKNVQKSGYMKPTPVQKHSIPTLMSNRDLMSCAQTGSGKTAAFLLPIIHHILADGPEAVKQSTMTSQGRRCYYPSALILSPTRELAIQIHKEASKFSYRTNLITAILYGGRENYRDQIQKLRSGCNILIATPGRLIDIIEQGYIGLAGCRYLVLDEADRMLDMGFEPQIRKIVEQGQMPEKTARTTAMFSATFPKAIQELAQDFLKPDYLFLAVGRVGSTSENIDQELVFVEEHEKKRALMDILSQEDQSNLALIFVETKRGANDLSYYLQRQSIRAVAIHGDLKQFEREKNLESFRNGHFPILVATAVAARGLDIPNVKHVINHDLPGDIDEYVHRIGRTGRCGNTGKATSFFNDKNRGIARDLMTLMGEANKEIPDWLQRAAAEGRITSSGRGRGGRFGGTDFRRGRGGYQTGAQFAAGGYGGNFGGSFGTFNQNDTTPPRNGWQQGGRSNGFFDNGQNFGNGFNGGRGGFGGYQQFSQPPPNFGGYPNSFQPQQQNGFQQGGHYQQQRFDNWQ